MSNLISKPGVAGLFFATAVFGVSYAPSSAAQQPAEPSRTSAPPWRTSFRLEAEQYASPIALSDTDGEWVHGYRPKDRNTAYATLRAELQMSKGPWQVGLIKRSEKAAYLNRDAAALYQSYSTRQDPSASRTYQLAVRTQQFEGAGFSLGYDEVRDGLSRDGMADGVLSGLGLGAIELGVVLDQLSLTQAREGQLSGDASFTLPSTYAFNVRSVDASPRVTQAPLAPPFGSRGALTSLSLRLATALSPADRVGVDVQDLWSRLRWSGLPMADDTLNSNVTSKTPDGYLEYAPLLTGVRRNDGLLKQLSPKWTVYWRRQLDWGWGDGAAGNKAEIKLAAYRKFEINGMQAGWLLTRGADGGGVGYDTGTASLDARWQYKGVWLGYGADSFKRNTRHFEKISMGASLVW